MLCDTVYVPYHTSIIQVFSMHSDHQSVSTNF